MQKRILRLAATIDKTGLSRSSIYAGIRDGSFVQPVKIGERAIGFVESEIDKWIDERISESRGGIAA